MYVQLKFIYASTWLERGAKKRQKILIEINNFFETKKNE